jgi:hypothetical protein
MQAYVTESNLFGYAIYFENETNASSAAQDVQISNPLPATLDWQTFQLGEIAFGNVFIPIPLNVQYFQTNVPLSYNGVSFEVFIDAGIDLASGEVFANFFSINPTTGLPPTNGIGFLPPDDANGAGRGHITYTIRPMPGLPQGTQIPNVAYVQFDGNAPIATDLVNDSDPSGPIDTNKQAIVTIDNSIPTGSVIWLPSVTTTTNFQVCWTGSDTGSAIVAYDIYASTNNGSWGVWLEGTTNTCEEFYGQVGTIYSFYSVAHNGVGTVQPIPTGANTTTLIILPPQISPVPNYFIAVGQQLIFTNTAQDPYSPITFSLGAKAPTNASIDSSGVFRWTPTCDEASTTNLIAVWATDSYSTPLSNSVSFTVVVSDCLQVSIGSTVMQVGTTSSVPASVISPLGLTNLSFTVVYPTNRFTNWVMIPSNNAIGTALVESIGSSQSMFSLAAGTGQTITGPALLGSLSFTALPGSSAFVPLVITNVVGIKTNGTPVGNSSGQAGRVVVIGLQPLLAGLLDANSMRVLTIYGNPGSSYELAFVTNVILTNWQPVGSVLMTNLQQNTNVDQSAPQIYYRLQ